MALSRARGVALLVISTLLAVLAVAMGAGSPAAAATRGAPSVSLRQVGVDAVTVSGRTASASARVRFDRRTTSGWALVKHARARHHHYATTLSVVAGASVTFKVSSNRRSRTFVVRMPASGASATTTSTTPEAAKPPTAPTLYDACGARPRKGDGSAWSCTFHDDFDGTTLDGTKWVPQVTATSSYLTGDRTAGYACYVDDPDNIAVGSGMLRLTVRSESVVQRCGSQYTAGSVSTHQRFSQQYGRFEARIRNTATSAPGLQETFWLWPDDRFTTVDRLNTGEIDVSETYSVYPDVSIPFLHYGAEPTPRAGVNTAWNCAAARGQWNTYTLEWTPTRLSIFVNGTLCLSNTSGDSVFQSRHILALTQALGAGTDAMTADTPIPASMDIDYVRAWS